MHLGFPVRIIGGRSDSRVHAGAVGEHSGCQISCRSRGNTTVVSASPSWPRSAKKCSAKWHPQANVRARSRQLPRGQTQRVTLVAAATQRICGVRLAGSRCGRCGRLREMLPNSSRPRGSEFHSPKFGSGDLGEIRRFVILRPGRQLGGLRFVLRFRRRHRLDVQLSHPLFDLGSVMIASSTCLSFALSVMSPFM